MKLISVGQNAAVLQIVKKTRVQCSQPRGKGRDRKAVRLRNKQQLNLNRDVAVKSCVDVRGSRSTLHPAFIVHRYKVLPSMLRLLQAMLHARHASTACSLSLRLALSQVWIFPCELSFFLPAAERTNKRPIENLASGK